MSYQKLNIFEFGTHLLTTNELDPVYVALVDTGWEWQHLYRWLIAYWCFYNCGVASYLSEFEGKEFWDRMEVAAVNEVPNPLGDRWARGSERRHFRGQQAIKAVAELRARYGKRPHDMVASIAGEAPDYVRIAKQVKTHRGFGDWISFKVADMVDRVLGVPVDFTEAAVFMFKDPVKAALMLWREEQKLSPLAKPKNQTYVIHKVVEMLEDHFSEFKAPPYYDRPVSLQEVETILCCWKSHMNGHYPLFNDIREIRSAVQPWVTTCKTAMQFLEHMPVGEVSDSNSQSN